MEKSEPRRRRAGEAVEDLCRACKAMRDHTVIAVDGQGVPLRVSCDFCGSQHNYRGGAETAARSAATRRPSPRRSSSGHDEKGHSSP